MRFCHYYFLLQVDQLYFICYHCFAEIWIDILILLMRKIPLTPKKQLEHSYKKIISSKNPLTTKLLNTSLLSNPFIASEQSYKIIMSFFTKYNKRVELNQIFDEYEVKSYERLFTLVSDIAQVEGKVNQIQMINEVGMWWNEQNRLVRQRDDLGVVKYKTDRKTEKIKDRLRMNKSLEVRNQQSYKKNSKIYDNRMEELMPFIYDNRAKHQEYYKPEQRLKQFKHKNLCTISVIDKEENKKYVDRRLDKRIYPRPIIQEKEEEDNILAEDINNDEPTQNKPEGQAQPEGENPQQPKGQGKPQEVVQEQPQIELGFGGGEEGEHDEQPEEQQEILDKLAPKDKIFKSSILQQIEYQKAHKHYNQPYMFYRGYNSSPERRMQQKYLNNQKSTLLRKREDDKFIEKAHKWAKYKTNLEKQLENKLENMTLKYRYKASLQQQQPVQKLNPNDQKKYGFTIPVQSIVNPEIDMTMQQYTSTILPRKPYEKSIRNHRLSSLKHKFAKILNIQEIQSRQVEPSLCFYNPRVKKTFSQILDEYSPEKQKDKEIEEIHRIKRSLGKLKINVGLNELRKSLVHQSPQKESIENFPSKELPNNPFFDVGAKKKKKK